MPMLYNVYSNLGLIAINTLCMSVCVCVQHAYVHVCVSVHVVSLIILLEVS